MKAARLPHFAGCFLLFKERSCRWKFPGGSFREEFSCHKRLCIPGSAESCSRQPQSCNTAGNGYRLCSWEYLLPPAARTGSPSRQCPVFGKGVVVLYALDGVKFSKYPAGTDRVDAGYRGQADCL